MKKKALILSLLLIFVMFLPAMAQDEEIFTSGDWQYKANASGWVITDYFGNDKNIEIPYEFNGTYVTELGEGLFANLVNIERVSIPSQVSVIGKNAFNGCSSLKEVVMPYQIKSLPEGCFFHCVSLESITLPSTLTSIGKNAFADCTSLTEIIVPSNVTTIGESAFANCTSLSSIFVSRKLATVNANAFINTAWLDAQEDEFVFIGRGILVKYNGNDTNVVVPYGTVAIANAFEGNTTIETVEITETVRRIMQNGFKDCVNLRFVEFPIYLTTIAANAFQNCRSLTEVNIPDTVTSVGSNAFMGCSKLTSLVFPEKVTNIQNGVARDCPVLSYVYIPEGATAFHKNAFLNSENVDIQIASGSAVEAILQENNIPYSYHSLQEGDFIYKQAEDGIEIVRYSGNLFDVEIPLEINGTMVTSVGTAAFQNNDSVHRIIIPLSVKTIGDWAFSYMDSLEAIQIPLGMKTIGANVFTGSDSLQEVRIPIGVDFIGMSPFDPDSGTTLCVNEGSAAESLLMGMGYTVSPYDLCADTNDSMLLFGESNYLADAPAVCEAVSVPDKNANGDPINMIQIPAGLNEITADLVKGFEGDLILVIPEAVEAIDPAILTGRTVTIIGDSGSYAESFARENNITFMVPTK